MAVELPSLTTPRLVLRPFRSSDGSDVERLAGVWEVADTTLNIPHPYPEGGGAGWIKTHAATWKKGTSLTLAIVLRDTPEKLIGAVSLEIAREHARGELGYWIALDEWGHGYATEAARAVAAFGFEKLELHRIQARHFTRNEASGRVMQKLGMQFEGGIREGYLRWGRFEDVSCYGVLAHEWAEEPSDAQSGTRLKFRDAKLNDVPMIAALQNTAAGALTARFGEGHWSSLVTERGAALAQRHARVRVGLSGKRILTVLRLATKKPWAIDVSYFTPVKRPLYLTGMAVSVPHQGQGLGRLAVEDAIAVALDWPADAIRLDAYDAVAGAGSFYAKCGFQERGHVVYKGDPLVYYESLLT
jgi:RimJ/RimL family protein N-acetyltransferase